jgi:hypothetical protein
MFLDGRVGEGKGRFDVKGEEGHFDIEWGVVQRGRGRKGRKRGDGKRWRYKMGGKSRPVDLDQNRNQRSLWSGEQQSSLDALEWPITGRGHSLSGQSHPRPRLSHRPPRFLVQPMFSFASILVIIIAAVPPSRPFQLYHRVLDPSLPESSFLNRASILSDGVGNLRIEPAPTFQSDFESAHVTDALYQLALDPSRPGQSTSLWLVSSVKAVISFPSLLPALPHLPLLSATSSRMPTSTSSSISPTLAAHHSPLSIS